MHRKESPRLLDNTQLSPPTPASVGARRKDFKGPEARGSHLHTRAEDPAYREMELCVGGCLCALGKWIQGEYDGVKVLRRSLALEAQE